MSRAKRIEEAARALTDYREAGAPDEWADWDAKWGALRSALALPEGESEVGWIVRPVGSPSLRYEVVSAPQARERVRWYESAHRFGHQMEMVRVRITVEGEEARR